MNDERIHITSYFDALGAAARASRGALQDFRVIAARAATAYPVHSVALRGSATRCGQQAHAGRQEIRVQTGTLVTDQSGTGYSLQASPGRGGPCMPWARTDGCRNVEDESGARVRRVRSPSVRPQGSGSARCTTPSSCPRRHPNCVQQPVRAALWCVIDSATAECRDRKPREVCVGVPRPLVFGCPHAPPQPRFAGESP